MWDNAVSDLNTELQTASRVLVAMVGEHPTMTAVIFLLFTLLGTLLAAEIAAEIIDGRATAARADEAQPMKR